MTRRADYLGGLTMDEYIKRDELAKALADLMISPWATESHIMHCAGIHEALHLVQDMVNDEVPKSLRLPAADVVEVVRCKDCKYSYDGADSWCCSYGVCAGCIVPGDFYCKCGERKEKE